MAKVVFLKLDCQASSLIAFTTDSLASTAHERSALVVSRSPDGFLEIRGHTPACKDRHRAWCVFYNAVKSQLGIPESTPICVRFADPPFDVVSDVGSILQEPKHIVDLVVSPIANVQVITSRRLNGKDRGFAARGNKWNFLEMNRLLSQLTEVGLSLQRTQQACNQIAKRCGNKRKCAENYHERTPQTSLAINDGAATVRAESGVDFRVDSNVEKLLHVAESLTSQVVEHHTDGEEDTDSAILPECPSNVCVRPNFSGGLYVLWNPVRLDSKDENRGHRVLGYLIYFDGMLKATVEGALAAQVEIHGIDNDMEISVQLCSSHMTFKQSGCPKWANTQAELCNSPLSPAVTYRHSHQRKVTKSQSQSARCKNGMKVEAWLKGSHPSYILATGPGSEVTTPGKSNASDGHAHNTYNVVSAPEAENADDTKSISSSHTSGIVTDLPISPKLSLVCGYKNHSVSPLSCVKESHKVLSEPGCYSPVASTLSVDNTVDTVIDEPLDLDLFSSEENLSIELFTPPDLRHSGPMPPGNISVRSHPSGYVYVSWTPVRRNLQGCSNGCFVLGYRIFVNGRAHLSVDGPTTFEALLQYANVPRHRILVHIRTRSIACESVPSNTVVYDTLMHQCLTKRTSDQRTETYV